MHQCPDILSAHHFLQVAVGVHIEYDDREVVLFTHRGRSVDTFQAPGMESHRRVAFRDLCCRIFLRISSSAITGTFKYHLDLDASQGRSVSMVKTDYPYRRT